MKGIKKKTKKEKLKILPPTMRMRKRYIKFEIVSEHAIIYEDLEHAIWNTLLDFYGEHGVAQTDMWLVKNLFDVKKQTGVIRCNHTSVPQVIAGLGLLTRLGDVRIIVKILKVSGTIRGLGKV